MSLSRNVFILAFVLLLSACGFTPQYGQQSTAQLDSVVIDNIPDRTGLFLRNALIDRFYTHGRPGNPAYLLQVTNLKESQYDLDITKTSDTTRAQLRITAHVTLKNNDSGQIILARDLQADVSYNILAGQFTTRVSEQAARENTLNDLAQQIETQVVLYLGQPHS